MKGEHAIAICHISIKIISRGKGKSAVAAAAYRAGERIINEYDGHIHDYTKKHGVAHTEIMLPDHAPREYCDRATLWNAVEAIEKNCNAQLAREFEIGLPVELSAEENLRLVREYVQRNFVGVGMCADICIHDKNDGNPHAHIMLTMRPIEPGGSWGAKSKKEYMLDENGDRIILKSGIFKTRKISSNDWNDQTKAEDWRKAWADCVNTALEKTNHTKRIDHRSYKRQGIEQIPTIHLGSIAAALERRGIQTERGDRNRNIASMNQELRQLGARMRKLQKQLDEEIKSENAVADSSTPAQPQNLISILLEKLNVTEKTSNYAKVNNLKTVAATIAFLQENNITTLPQLKEKVSAMYEKLGDTRDKLKPIERRLKTLDEHIQQTKSFKENRGIYQQYKAQKPRKQAAFYNAHSAEIILCESAGKYLKAHLNGRTKIPISAWKSEHEKLTAEKKNLYHEYSRQKDEVHQIEIIQKTANQVVRETNQRTLDSSKNRRTEL